MAKTKNNENAQVTAPPQTDAIPQVTAPPQPAVETVRYTFPVDMINGTQSISIRLNGKKKKFPRGVEVDVPVDYMLVYNDSMRSSREAQKFVRTQK